MSTMRQIMVSTATYSAIWGDRHPGEETEDAIIGRKFGVPQPSPPPSTTVNGKVGFRDPRFNIELPEGFEVFRTYLGKEYRARASDGAWVLATDGKKYPSFNQLSTAIGAKTENSWRNWYYLGPNGNRHLIDSLRK
jgi:hypothetical protein